jgi:hypothetical protein
MKSELIEKIKSRFKHEWLLIKVDRMDVHTTTPVSGHLIAHSPLRDEIYKKSIHAKGTTLIDYSDNTLPKGYAVAF